jgi:hypothetical protein
MSLNSNETEVASNFELLKPLPSYESKLRRREVKQLLSETVRLQRLSRYTILVAVASVTPPAVMRDPKKPVTIGPETTSMIHGGAIYGHQADGILYCLDMLAPRTDEEQWSQYTQQHLEMPEWLTERLS